MQAISPWRYIAGYPEPLQQQVRQLLAQGRLAQYRQARYPDAHEIRSDRALYHYVDAWRHRHLRHAPQVDKVSYDSRLDVLQQALGLHTARSLVHGGRLQARREIRIASVFREAPQAFLDMIVVHELAHLRHMQHDKAFYQLCEHMLPGYAQYEFDARLYLLELAWQEGAGECDEERA